MIKRTLRREPQVTAWFTEDGRLWICGEAVRLLAPEVEETVQKIQVSLSNRPLKGSRHVAVRWKKDSTCRSWDLKIRHWGTFFWPMALDLAKLGIPSESDYMKPRTRKLYYRVRIIAEKDK